MNWNFTFKVTIRHVKMCKTQKSTKLRMKMGVREIIVRKVECLEMNKMEKSIIRMEYTLKAFTAKVEANHATIDGVTYDTGP